VPGVWQQGLNGDGRLSLFEGVGFVSDWWAVLVKRRRQEKLWVRETKDEESRTRKSFFFVRRRRSPRIYVREKECTVRSSADLGIEIELFAEDGWEDGKVDRIRDLSFSAWTSSSPVSQSSVFGNVTLTLGCSRTARLHLALCLCGEIALAVEIDVDKRSKLCHSVDHECSGRSDRWP
jgi:hypothetical protein